MVQYNHTRQEFKLIGCDSWQNTITFCLLDSSYNETIFCSMTSWIEPSIRSMHVILLIKCQILLILRRPLETFTGNRAIISHTRYIHIYMLKSLWVPISLHRLVQNRWSFLIKPRWDFFWKFVYFDLVKFRTYVAFIKTKAELE